MSEELPEESDIWASDLLERKQEAEMLEGYVQSIAKRSFKREDKRSFTLAVEAGYGGGKTFFLRRLAKQLDQSHPVAFVDAWADDIADEPLGALAATLAEAIAPDRQGGDIEEKWNAFTSKAGKVARIAAGGAIRRGLGLLLTSAAVDAVEGVFAPGEEGDTYEEIAKVAGAKAADAALETLPEAALATRIADFNAGKQAIDEMQESLAAVIKELLANGQDGPVIIVIDELDRCRPTYALRLLEEIKHLFDVPGLVFVLGLHTEQLARSVSGAYGEKFDGRAYLSRFIDRTYTLREPSLHALLDQLFLDAQIENDRLLFSEIAVDLVRPRPYAPKPSEMMSHYMYSAGLVARDAYQVVDIVQTCCALTSPNRILGLLLFPMIVEKIRLGQSNTARDVEGAPWDEERVKNLAIRLFNYRTDKVEAKSLLDTFRGLKNIAQTPVAEAYKRKDLFADIVSDFRRNGPVIGIDELADPSHYQALIENVSRFGASNETF